MHCNVSTDERAQFSAQISASQLGQLRLASVSTSPLTVRRRRRDIARISDAPYLIKFQLAGEAYWSQRGKDVHLTPGDFVICSTAEPYSLSFQGAYQMPVLAVTDSVMRHLTPNPDQFLGRKMPAEDACCSLLSGFVADIVQKMPQLPEPMAQRIETNILDLLGGVLAAHSANGEHSRLSSADLLAKIKGFVIEQLRNRRLGPAMLAEAFGISTRYVHKLFESEAMTLSRFIRAERLKACRRSLADPALAHMSITDIALYWGFYDLSHMTRSFGAIYSESPRAYRTLALRNRIS